MTDVLDYLVVGTSSAFADSVLFREKLDNYLSGLAPLRVAAVNDASGLIRGYFGDKIDDVLSNPTSLGAKRRLIHDAKWIVLFWDGTGISDIVHMSSLARAKSKLIPVVTTRVVNKERNDEFDVYIGRGTPWGNPFAIGDGGTDRAAAIELFKEYFENKFVKDPTGNRDIRSLRGKVLGCHCKPAACHGDVIAKYLNRLTD